MATFSVNHDHLQLKLTGGEKLAGLHGDIDVPLGAVRGVEVEPDPIAAVHGWRAPGLGLPGRKKIGTWREHGRRRFVVARAGVPAVRVTLSGGEPDELLVSTPQAAQVAAELDARRRRP
jgi:hypothetical protein